MLAIYLKRCMNCLCIDRGQTYCIVETSARSDTGPAVQEEQEYRGHEHRPPPVQHRQVHTHLYPLTPLTNIVPFQIALTGIFMWEETKGCKLIHVF